MKLELTEKEFLALIGFLVGSEKASEKADEEVIPRMPENVSIKLPENVSIKLSPPEKVELQPQPEAEAKQELPQLDPETRAAAWAAWCHLIDLWATNFGVEGEQPDRLTALRDIGSGRHAFPILVMAYEERSLQRLIAKVVKVTASGDLEWCDRVAANMVQVSHMAFPDLAGTYDYSTKWRRG